MPPRQSYQPPSQPQQPQRTFAPNTPHYGYGSPDTQHFQQHPSGHYEVVPTPQPVQNVGRSGHNPYDFIVNPNAQTRPGFSSMMSSSSMVMRLALLGGIVVVIMIAAAVLMSALGPKSITPAMESIAERQQEMIRVSNNALQNQQVVTADGQNFVSNVEINITSDQMQITNYLAKHGTKMSSKELALDQSAQTDQMLSNAATANNYDSAIDQYMLDSLQTYEGLLTTTFNQAQGTDAKALLQSCYKNAQLLIQQGKELQQELNAGQGAS